MFFFFSLPALCQPPKQLTVRDITATNASLEWVYEGVCVTVSFVNGYRLTYSSNDANRLQLEIPDANVTTAILENLTPRTTYQVEVMVLTNNGKDSLPSNSVSLTTKEISKSNYLCSRL